MAILEVSKQFTSSKEKLYKAWTEPGNLQQWWRPMGNQLTSVENDVRQGGKIKYQFEKDELLIDGEYQKVENGLLEYSWKWHLKAEPINDAAYRLSVQFSGDEQTATINIKQDGFESDEHIKPHRQGWEDALESLKSFLEQSEQPMPAGVPHEKQHPPISGYMETPEQQKVGGG